MPYPKQNEKKDEFLDRCMSSKETNKKYPENDQRYAVCSSLWKMKDRKK